MTVLDDLEAGPFESRPARGRQLDHLLRGDQAPTRSRSRDAAATRQIPPADPFDQTVETADMVEVAMAQHDRFERVRRDAQPIEIADQTVRA